MSFRDGLTMLIRLAQLLYMMQLMKLIYQKKMYLILYMSAKAQEHVLSSFVHSLRMQASQVQDLVSQLFLKTLSVVMLCFTASGLEDMVLSLTVHHISSRELVRLYTQKKDRSRQEKDCILYE